MISLGVCESRETKLARNSWTWWGTAAITSAVVLSRRETPACRLLGSIIPWFVGLLLILYFGFPRAEFILCHLPKLVFGGIQSLVWKELLDDTYDVAQPVLVFFTK